MVQHIGFFFPFNQTRKEGYLIHLNLMIRKFAIVLFNFVNTWNQMKVVLLEVIETNKLYIISELKKLTNNTTKFFILLAVVVIGNILLQKKKSSKKQYPGDWFDQKNKYELKPKQRILINGLKSDKGKLLNGCFGHTLRKIGERYEVYVATEEVLEGGKRKVVRKSLKPENLIVVSKNLDVDWLTEDFMLVEDGLVKKKIAQILINQWNVFQHNPL
eukprot:UN23432